MATFDLAPARVTGGVRASRARVIWRDGVLYIARGVDRVESLEADEPVKTGSTWTAGELTIRKAGCKCGCGELCRKSADDLMAAAEGVTV